MKTSSISSAGFRAPTLPRSRDFTTMVVHRLLQGIRFGTLTVVEHGEQRTFGGGDAPHCRVEVKSPAVYGKILSAGAIGGAEAYMDGDWTTDNLTGLIRLLLKNRAVLEKMQSKMSWLSRLGHRLHHYSRRDTIQGSRRNIAEHYDLGNDFFRLFLDPTMMYSSGIFKQKTDSMEQASLHKLDIICRKLDLQPGDHLLEIGTGWGELAKHAAQHFGCQVTTTTISEEQHDHALDKIEAAGLSDRVTVLKQDYRNLTGRYNKLVSVEMIEAVGLENLPTFFETCARLLTDDGMMLLQSITIADQRYEAASRSVDFIQRYIFPGGALPSASVLLSTASQSSDLRGYALEDITEHYAETLHRWRQAFLSALPQVRQMNFDTHFIRMWDYYLAYCEGGFLERAIGCVHVQFHKPAFSRSLS